MDALPRRNTTGDGKILTRVGAVRAAGLALIATALPWVAALALTQFERDRAIAAAIRQNDARADSLGQHVLDQMDKAEMVIDQVAALMVSVDGKCVDAPRLEQIASALKARDPGFLGAAVVDRAGIVRAASSGVPAVAGGALTLPGDVAGRDDARPGAGMLRRLDAGGQRYAFLTRRYGPAGAAMCGSIALFIAPSALADVAPEAGLLPGEMLSVVGAGGVEIARRDGGRATTRQSRRQDAMPAPGNAARITPRIGADGVARYRSERTLPRYLATVASESSVSAIIAPLVARRAHYFGAAAVATIAILLIATIFMLRGQRGRHRYQELARLNQRLFEAQRVGAMGDWDYVPATDHLTWSPHLCEMYERRPDRSVSRLSDVDQYVAPAEREIIRNAIARVMERGERVEYILNVTLPSGVRHKREIVAVPTWGDNGKIVGIHGTDHDITAQSTLAELESRIVNMSRIDGINMIAGTIAHELRQPIAVAANYLGASRRILARTPSSLDAELIESLAGAEAQVHSMGHIVRAVIAMVSGTAERRRGSLGAICTAAASLARPTADHPFAMTLQIEPDADDIVVVTSQIQQVVLNLILNAIDARPEGGLAITISARRLSDETISVSVQDNGHGIATAPEDIFVAFATNKPNGLGLGLSVSRIIVEEHGGRIYADGSDPQGTTICFTLDTPGSST